jgi:peptide/nickel transport system permease protein
MLTFITHRLAGALLVVFGVVSIVFLLIHLIPGDPVEIMLGEAASVTDREALRTALGLDQPLARQFMAYLEGLLRLDLGNSYHSHRPVFELLLERLPATLVLAGMALLITLVMAVPLGIVAA